MCLQVRDLDKPWLHSGIWEGVVVGEAPAPWTLNSGKAQMAGWHESAGSITQNNPITHIPRVSLDEPQFL